MAGWVRNIDGGCGFQGITLSLQEHIFFRGAQARWAGRLGEPGKGVGPKGDGLAVVKIEEIESGLPEDLGQKQEVNKKRILNF
jgi:hypothetical protein